MTNIWNCLNPFIRLQKTSAMYGINSTEAFRAILERERARADRYEYKFSLVLFEAENTDLDDALAERLPNVLGHRKRYTDEVGWFDDKRIGIVLPYTTADGAWKVADDVRQLIAATSPPPTCTVYVYPSQFFPSQNTGLGQCSSNDLSNAGDDRDNESTCETFAWKTHNCAKRANALEPLLVTSLPIWKRAFDIVGGLICLVVCSPLFIVISLMVKLVSSGPVFFKQQRVGYQGKFFNCWKFRTMRVDADTSVHQHYLSRLINSDKAMTKLDRTDDSRIIPFGSMLRQTGLDELPQLFNIIRGEMSFIGPRPCLPYEAQEFRPWQRRRFDTVPGVTGLWQVSGKNRTTFKDMMRLDLRYIKKRSYRLDTKILLKTLPAISTQINDYVSQRKDKQNEKSI